MISGPLRAAESSSRDLCALADFSTHIDTLQRSHALLEIQVAILVPPAHTPLGTLPWAHSLGHTPLDTLPWIRSLGHTPLDTLPWIRSLGHTPLDTLPWTRSCPHSLGHTPLDTLPWTRSLGHTPLGTHTQLGAAGPAHPDPIHGCAFTGVSKSPHTHPLQRTSIAFVAASAALNTFSKPSASACRAKWVMMYTRSSRATPWCPSILQPTKKVAGSLDSPGVTSVCPEQMHCTGARCKASGGTARRAGASTARHCKASRCALQGE